MGRNDHALTLINNSHFNNCENSTEENHSFLGLMISFLGVSEAKLPIY